MGNYDKRTQGKSRVPTLQEAMSIAVGERPVELRLEKITVDQRLQVRRNGLNEEHLEKLIAALGRGETIPEPVVVSKTSDGAYLLADGFHRTEAHRQAGIAAIAATIKEGEWQDARRYAEQANRRNALPLTRDDLKGILEFWLETKYCFTNGVLWSNGLIESQLGPSDKTIASWLEELATGKNFPVDFSRRVGEDGRVYEVESIQKSNQQRAAEAAELKAREEAARRAAEEAERQAAIEVEAERRAALRTLPAVDKIRALVKLLMKQHARKAFFDDPEFGLEWCRQVTTLTMDVALEQQFLRDYAAKPAGLYLDFLRHTTGVIWDRAENEAWTDTDVSEWVFANKPRANPSGYGQGKPPETFQRTGMAQPKNPNVEPPQPKVLGRHHAGATPSVAATEPVTENTASSRWSEGNLVWGIHPKALFRVVFVMHYPEVKNYRYTVETPDGDTVGRTFWEHELRTPTEQELKDATEPAAELFKPRPSCPFWIGTNVQVIETGERGIVQHTEYADDEWQIRVELYDGLKTFKVHEIERPFREQVDEALSFPSMGAATAAILDEAASELPDELDDDEVNTNPPPCPYHPGDVVKYLPNEMKCELLDTKWDGHVWWLLVRDENDQEWDAPINQFERVGVLLDSHAPPPAVDGAYWVDDDLEGDGVDNIDEKIQYFDAHPEEASEALRQRYNIPAPPQNGKRQAEMMVEDARTIVPRLVMDSTHAAVDFRSTTLVRWESPKSIETIVASADKKELKLLKRELERAIAEFNAVTQGSQRASSRCQDMLRQIRPYCE